MIVNHIKDVRSTHLYEVGLLKSSKYDSMVWLNVPKFLK